ncbi:hypothetical protein TH63_07905 [Rufibacter radiotolerans]|uniref:Cthe-2314-like HEPN domain-containing protein n=1 Tax=Rufibacter radiotolerans TaxID=1379910 RepID=A0A0H4VII6_9BACT|nr:hypothetical protein [Rufibacter radiotolerans]AKQ45590.1 hypothetical protein TH63_07905 [Rufibacter radiotolerans]
MNKFDKAKYSNHTTSVLRLEGKRKFLKNLLVKMVFEYSNKISGSIANNDFIELRNSITLRLESIFYHYDLLASINISGEESINNKQISPLITSQIALKQDFLLDSIIFNTLSLFDYTSCLTKFILEDNKQKKKLLWTQLVRTSRGTGNFKETSLAKLINDLDKNWVFKLGEYRAELIHYKDDFVSESLKHYVKEGKYIISISAPSSLKKHFKEFKLVDNNKASINEVSLWVIENSIECVICLVEELINYFDIIRKVPLGKEIITHKQ